MEDHLYKVRITKTLNLSLKEDSSTDWWLLQPEYDQICICFTIYVSICIIKGIISAFFIALFTERIDRSISYRESHEHITYGRYIKCAFYIWYKQRNQIKVQYVQIKANTNNNNNNNREIFKVISKFLFFCQKAQNLTKIPPYSTCIRQFYNKYISKVCLPHLI